MAGRFDEYNVAVIDASLFTHRLSQEFLNGLKTIKYIYVAGTFNSEIHELIEMLPASERVNCENNLQLLNEVIRPKQMNLSQYPNYNWDVWDFLRLIATRPNADKLLLVTANLSLIQRVVCSHLPMDIYNLSGSYIISHLSYSVIDKKYAVDNNDEPYCAEVAHNIGEGSTLYVERSHSARNETVVLGKMLGEGAGGEGNVYHLKDSQPHEVGKIFKTGQFPSNKYAAVKHMMDNRLFGMIRWTEFPTGILYADSAYKQPVGIIEHYTKTQSTLYDDELFYGDTGNWSSSLLDVRVSDLLYLCKCITRQVCYLSMLGVSVADYNIKNFDYPLRSLSVTGNGDAAACTYIQMWDSDSFGYRNYFSGFMADSGKAHEYDITKRTDICNLCNDELYNFLFQILTLGDTPYNPVTGLFNYQSPDYINYARKQFVPPSIWTAFEKFFTGQTISSPQMMLHLLSEELKKRKSAPLYDSTYKDIVNQIDDGYLKENDKLLPPVLSPARNLFPGGIRLTDNNPEVPAPPLDPTPIIINDPPEPDDTDDPGGDTIGKKTAGCFASCIPFILFILLLLYLLSGHF